MISRTAATWRDLPTLSLDETATILGVCRREVVKHLDERGIETIRWGRRRLVVTRSLRAWLREVGAEAPEKPAPSAAVARKSATLVRRLG